MELIKKLKKLSSKELAEWFIELKHEIINYQTLRMMSSKIGEEEFEDAKRLIELVYGTDKVCKNCTYFFKGKKDIPNELIEKNILVADHIWRNYPLEEPGGCCTCPKFRLGYSGSGFKDYDKQDINEFGNRTSEMPDEVQIEDDSGWGFRVGIDFGCVHFKGRLVK